MEISSSGPGEGLGGAIPLGYSTSRFFATRAGSEPWIGLDRPDHRADNVKLGKIKQVFRDPCG